MAAIVPDGSSALNFWLMVFMADTMLMRLMIYWGCILVSRVVGRNAVFVSHHLSLLSCTGFDPACTLRTKIWRDGHSFCTQTFPRYCSSIILSWSGNTC
jgi:hypothetical protein